MLKWCSFVALALSWSVAAAGQQLTDADGTYNPVPALRDEIPDLRVEFTTFRDATMADGNLSSEEKILRIMRKYQTMQDEFRVRRRTAYEAYYRHVSSENSCTSSGGGERTCPPEPSRCIDASPGEVIEPGWADWYGGSNVTMAALRTFNAGPRAVWRSDGARMVFANGTRFCPPTLRKSSSGAIRALALGYFKYRPDYIARAVDRDASEVAAQIQSLFVSILRPVE